MNVDIYSDSGRISELFRKRELRTFIVRHEGNRRYFVKAMPILGKPKKFRCIVSDDEIEVTELEKN